MPTVERLPHLAPQILFVDGLSGTGKTMMGPILSSFDRVEVHRIDNIYEYVPIFWLLGRMEEDVATWFIRTYTDQACYHGMIGRESNFRWKDLTGVLRNPGGWRYLRRLFQAEGDVVVNRIKERRPILHFISHQVVSPILFRALGERVRVVEMVRNPLYLVPHWYSYLDRIGTHPRDLYVCFNYKGQSLPWFTWGWEDKYLASNKMDRVILLLDRLMRLDQANLDALGETLSNQVVMVPFERFVVDPWPYLNRIGALLDTKATSLTPKVLRQEKVPRRVTTGGRDLPIYRRYHWQPPARRITEEEEFQKRWDNVAQAATAEGMAMLEAMCTDYSRRYLGAEVARQVAAPS